MRNYTSEKENSIKKSLIKSIVTLTAPICIFYIILCLFAFIIASTDFPEKYESFITIATTAIMAITQAFMLTLLFKIKPIYCSLISFTMITAFKFISNLILSTPITFGRQGVLGLVFTLLFSILGSILAIFFKK